MKSLKNNMTRWVRYGLGGVIIIGACLWVLPHIVGIYYQTRAGVLITNLLEQRVDIDAIACTKAPLAITHNQGTAEKAIYQLDEALRYMPDLAQAYLFKGRAYCLLGEPGKAVMAYEAYTQFKPENPLGHLEMAMAYEALCARGLIQETQRGDYVFCSDEAFQGKIVAAWQAANVTYQDFIDLGERARLLGEFETASDFFKRASFIKIYEEGAEQLFFSDDVLVLEDFATISAWIPCRWCENAEGKFVSDDGILELSYANNIQERDMFVYRFRKIEIPIVGVDQLVLRLRGDTGTLAFLELVIDGVRSRPINYNMAPYEWQIVPISVQGEILNEIMLGIGEKDADSQIVSYQLFIDWIILR